MSELAMDRMQVRLEALKLAVNHIEQYNTQNTDKGTNEILLMALKFEKYIEEGKAS